MPNVAPCHPASACLPSFSSHPRKVAGGQLTLGKMKELEHLLASSASVHKSKGLRGFAKGHSFMHAIWQGHA